MLRQSSSGTGYSAVWDSCAGLQRPSVKNINAALRMSKACRTSNVGFPLFICIRCAVNGSSSVVAFTETLLMNLPDVLHRMTPLLSSNMRWSSLLSSANFLPANQCTYEQHWTPILTRMTMQHIRRAVPNMSLMHQPACAKCLPAHVTAIAMHPKSQTTERSSSANRCAHRHRRILLHAHACQF